MLGILKVFQVSVISNDLKTNKDFGLFFRREVINAQIWLKLFARRCQSTAEKAQRGG